MKPLQQKQKTRAEGMGAEPEGPGIGGAVGEEPSHHFLVFTHVSPLRRTGVAFSQ